jgi:phosphohistidine phosphatase
LQLLIIRHAIAGSREEFGATGQDDDLRPLTHTGRARMRRGARGLRRQAPEIQLLASSPLLRATQTAALVAAAYANMPWEEADVLRPDASLPAFVAWLRERREREVVAVVGHEPHLSTLASWLLTGERRPLLQIKKGAACLLDFPSTPRRGAATLHWSLTPAQLRALAS